MRAKSYSTPIDVYCVNRRLARRVSQINGHAARVPKVRVTIEAYSLSLPVNGPAGSNYRK